MKKIIRKEKIKKFFDSRNADRLGYTLTIIWLVIGLYFNKNHLILGIISAPYFAYIGTYLYLNRKYLKNNPSPTMEKIIRKEKIKKFFDSRNADRLGYTLTIIWLVIGLYFNKNHLILGIISAPYFAYIGTYLYLNRKYLKNNPSPTMEKNNV